MRRPLLALALLLASCGALRPDVPKELQVVRPEEPPPPPELVAAAQERLQELELWTGPLDGDLDPSLRVSIARFQRQNELEVTGTLNPDTVAALGLRVEERSPVAPREGAPLPGPTAEELLGLIEARPLPQPPPGALDGVLAEAAERIAAGEEAARLVLAEPASGAAQQQQASAAAQRHLERARAEAFDRVQQARREGGYALLPQPLIEALERALVRRALLLRRPDGILGPDDEAAIRWLERSASLPVTGEPGLGVLELLGIDPTPMFQH